MFHILLVSPAKSWRGLRGSKFYIVTFLPHPLSTDTCQVTSPALYIKIVVRSHFFLNCGFFVFQNIQGDNYAEKWILAHVHRRRRFSRGCPAFFGESCLLGWPTGIVILHTYFCLVIRVNRQWEFQLRGRQLEDLLQSSNPAATPLLTLSRRRACLSLLPFSGFSPTPLHSG